MKPRDWVMQLWLMRKPPWKEFGIVSRIRGINYDQSISALKQFNNLKSKRPTRNQLPVLNKGRKGDSLSMYKYSM